MNSKKHPIFPSAKKFKVSKFPGNVMASAFWDTAITPL